MPIETTIFLRSPIALSAPGLKIRFRPVRQENCPSLFEIGAGLVKGLGGAAAALRGMAARIEATGPGPWIFVMRGASADCDRTDAHVSVIDVPAFVRGIERAAAG